MITFDLGSVAVEIADSNELEAEDFAPVTDIFAIAPLGCPTVDTVVGATFDEDDAAGRRNVDETTAFSCCFLASFKDGISNRCDI